MTSEERNQERSQINRQPNVKAPTFAAPPASDLYLSPAVSSREASTAFLVCGSSPSKISLFGPRFHETPIR